MNLIAIKEALAYNYYNLSANIPVKAKKSACVLAVISGASLVSYSPNIYAAWCGCMPTIDAEWQPTSKTLMKGVSAAIAATTEALTSQQQFNLMRLQSVLKLITKQTGVNADKLGQTFVSDMQSLAAFEQSLRTSEAMLDTVLTYGPMSQGTDPCRDQSTTDDINHALAGTAQTVPGLIQTEIAAAPGKLSNPAEFVSKTVTDITGKYCTPEMAQAGVCTAGPQAGQDIDATALFNSGVAQNSEVNTARKQMINYIYGAPDRMPDKAMANHPNMTAYLASKRTKDAFSSITQNSFKTIQEWNTTADDGSPGAMAALEKKVAIYNGGPEYLAWERGINTMTSSRGLMLEWVKMRSAELQTKQLEYETLQRQEMLTAALVALESKKLQNTNSKNSVDTLTANARAKVK
jgi:hypothetical protein